MMRAFFKYCIFLFIIYILSSCEDLILGPQPKFNDKQEFIPSLNVFGILRPDSLYNQPASFFNVGIIAPTVNDTSSSWLLFYAEIKVIDMSGTDTIKYTSEIDSIGQQQYINYNFSPIENNSYKLICYHEGYDTVYGITSIPAKATVLESLYSNNKINLKLQNDPSVYMFDIYVYTDDNVLFERKQPNPEETETLVEMNISEKPDYIDIYTYDMNLTRYYRSNNVFFKPNTYRELFSSVENGYGCFGSLNKLRIKID